MVLSLRIKKRYFNEIIEGSKKVEFRLMHKYYQNIINKNPDKVLFLCGKNYAKYQIKKIDEVILSDECKFYAIYLGKRIN